MIKLLLTFFLFVICGAGFATENEFSIPEEHRKLFMKALSGAWDGEALETPRGQVDYDIRFYPCREGVLAGVAETGASLHYWYFVEKDGALRLKFLSTFAGNRQSVLLVPAKLEGNRLHFIAPELALLSVSIEYFGEQVDIRIFHYKKPHVHIRLERTDTLGISSNQRGSFCETLPKSLLDAH